MSRFLRTILAWASDTSVSPLMVNLFTLLVFISIWTGDAVGAIPWAIIVLAWTVRLTFAPVNVSGETGVTINPTLFVHTPDADAFRKSGALASRPLRAPPPTKSY